MRNHVSCSALAAAAIETVNSRLWSTLWKGRGGWHDEAGQEGNGYGQEGHSEAYPPGPRFSHNASGSVGTPSALVQATETVTFLLSLPIGRRGFDDASTVAHELEAVAAGGACPDSSVCECSAMLSRGEGSPPSERSASANASDDQGDSSDVRGPRRRADPYSGLLSSHSLLPTHLALHFSLMPHSSPLNSSRIPHAHTLTPRPHYTPSVSPLSPLTHTLARPLNLAILHILHSSSTLAAPTGAHPHPHPHPHPRPHPPSPSPTPSPTSSPTPLADSCMGQV